MVRRTPGAGAAPLNAFSWGPAPQTHYRGGRTPKHITVETYTPPNAFPWGTHTPKCITVGDLHPQTHYMGTCTPKCIPEGPTPPNAFPWGARTLKSIPVGACTPKRECGGPHPTNAFLWGPTPQKTFLWGPAPPNALCGDPHPQTHSRGGPTPHKCIAWGPAPPKAFPWLPGALSAGQLPLRGPSWSTWQDVPGPPPRCRSAAPAATRPTEHAEENVGGFLHLRGALPVEKAPFLYKRVIVSSPLYLATKGVASFVSVP